MAEFRVDDLKTCGCHLVRVSKSCSIEFEIPVDQSLSLLLTRYFESHPDPQLMLDPRTGELLRANRPAAGILGGTMEEWSQRSFADWTAALGMIDFPIEQWQQLVENLTGQPMSELADSRNRTTSVMIPAAAPADPGSGRAPEGQTRGYEFRVEALAGDAAAPLLVQFSHVVPFRQEAAGAANAPVSAADTSPVSEAPVSEAPEGDDAAVVPAEVSVAVADSDQTRERMRHLGEQFGELSTHVPGLLYQTMGREDGTGFDVPYISPRSIEYLGWTPEEIYERPLRLLEAIYPQDQPLYYQKAVESMRSCLPFQVELRLVSRTGEIRWMRVTSHCRRLPEGMLIYNGVAIDITERKNIEEAIRTTHDEKERQVQLRTSELTRTNHDLQYEIAQRRKMEEWVGDLQTQMAQASRLSIMGEMAAGFAHEVHQPLAVIANYAHGILRRLDSNKLDEESLREVVKSIASEAMRTGEIVRRIRQFITNRESTRELLDVGVLTREAMELVRSHCQRSGVTARLEIGPDLLQVHGNRLQLTQVMVNLLLNGIDAMRDVAEEPKSIVMRVAQSSPQMMEISVVDKGPGISPQMHQKVFEQFFTTKREGLGMGLSVSRSLVESHGGRMWLESTPGEGSTMFFTLPTAERPNPDPARESGGLAHNGMVPTGLS